MTTTTTTTTVTEMIDTLVPDGSEPKQFEFDNWARRIVFVLFSYYYFFPTFVHCYSVATYLSKTISLHSYSEM